MVVDGKDLRAGMISARRVLFLIAFFFSLSLCAFAENTHQIQSVDLTKDLCSSDQVLINTPEGGIEFLSENEALAYTVCRGTGEPELSIRGELRASDSAHLKAAIFNVTTGKIEHHYDWPTQGHNSFIAVTAKENLLVVRDNFLDTYDVAGTRLAHLELQRVNFHDPLIEIPADPVNSLAVTEVAMTVKGVLLTATLVLNEDTLQPAFHWAARNQPENRVIAASSTLGVGWQDMGNEKHIVIRKPADKEWTTVWSGQSSDLLGPQFLGPSRFIIASDNAVMIFNINGKLENQLAVKAAAQVSLSRDGHYLAIASPEDSPSAAFLPATRIRIFDTSFQLQATLTNFSSLDSDFTFAMSPNGGKLAILRNMHVKVMEITK
jgi:hypothetical protein